MNSKLKVYFKTFGCRTNIYDTALIKENLNNYVEVDENEADYVVINSCTVTNGADNNVRQYINKINRRNPNAKLYFTGCGSKTTMANKLYNDGKIYSLFTADRKKDIEKIMSEGRLKHMGSLDYIDDTIISDMRGKTRGFVKIQEGCDFSCSYCVIPQVRGKSRSINVDTILKQIELLAQKGCLEVVLTGTNIGSYGKNITNMNLAKLLKKISQVKGIKRVRMGSIEPLHVTKELKEILNESWFNKHLHIAIQHSNDEMLKIMNRRNRVSRDKELFSELYSDYNIAIGTDYIVGHPGENDELWSDAMKNMYNMNVTHIHPFTYSRRENTKSAEYKEIINGKVSSMRLHELNSIIDKKNLKFREDNSIKLDVLIEQFKNGYYIGYDQFFNKMYIDSSKDILKSMVSISSYSSSLDGNYCAY